MLVLVEEVFLTGMESSARAMKKCSAFTAGVWQGTQSYQKVTAFDIIPGVTVSNTHEDTDKKIAIWYGEQRNITAHDLLIGN